MERDDGAYEPAGAQGRTRSHQENLPSQGKEMLTSLAEQGLPLQAQVVATEPVERGADAIPGSLGPPRRTLTPVLDEL